MKATEVEKITLFECESCHEKYIDEFSVSKCPFCGKDVCSNCQKDQFLNNSYIWSPLCQKCSKKFQEKVWELAKKMSKGKN